MGLPKNLTHENINKDAIYLGSNCHGGSEVQVN
jgi:hypothetical protein